MNNNSINKQDRSSNNIISPKNFFLHIFTIVTFYFFIINLIVLMFQSINLLFPDSLSMNYIYSGAKESIRFSLSSIIVIFPTFLISSFFLEKSYKENLEARNMKIRKWLVYFTIFVSLIVVVSNLITILFWFLKGEITLRFILKAISLLVIISFVSFYYIRDIKNKISSQERKIWLISAVIIFLASIILGFYLSGSPKQERLKRFDSERVENLNIIQREITYYFQRKGSLPENLEKIEDPVRGFRLPIDPESKEDYEYKIITEDSFEICANFNLVSDSSKENFPTYSSDYAFFEHGKGRECFVRTIDKDLYPKLKPEEIINK